MEDEITRSFNHTDYVDDEEDAQLAHARYQSLEQHWFEHDQRVYRASRAAKNKMIKAFGSWVIDTNVPFTVVDSVYTNPHLETIREIFLYKDRRGSFGSSIAQRIITSLMPEEHLSPSSSHGESGGGGDGGNGGANEIGAFYSSRPSTYYFTDRGCGVTVEDDRRSRRSPDEQPREPTQTYHHMRKGKKRVQPHGYLTAAMYGYVGFQEVPSSFTGPGLFAPSGGYDTYGGVSNNYGYSSTNTNCPPSPYPSHEPQFVGSDLNRRHRDNPPIINQGTIKCGNHHYHQPTFYSSNSTSSEQSWMDSTTSSIFYPQQESYGVDQNNDDIYQDPPRHSFWR
ncbi:hypothetical protein Cgig2_012555 [Carnegiea gigantea]|uniref:Uncharacterized protein n=1 Tax=Carnegiea gigantea TaxID=171969 RepID=A0A9Q1QBC6_9CARY|nr:hypothetical protein Cgig2_012555 [Carnegiea gigantea]